jgi:DNA-binding HxlR family transcriptional regulator
MAGRTPDLLTALGKRDGQHVLARLVERPARVGELVDHKASIRQPTVSRRLGELEAIGLVHHGHKKDLYSLTRSKQLRALLQADRRRHDTALWMALGRPYAIEMALALIGKPRTANELTNLIDGLDSRTTSRRIAELTAAGALRRSSSGTHHLVSASHMRSLLRSFSRLAEDLLAADLAAERSLQQRLTAPGQGTDH